MALTTLCRRSWLAGWWAATAVAASVASAGCAPLPPYARGALMERCMVAPLSELELGHDAHVHATREGMDGATGHGGPACGCN